MIYITGDTHGYYDRFAEIEETYELKKGDYLIICGDFGFLKTSKKSIEYYPESEDLIAKAIDADNEVLDKLAQKEYNILFIDGNHAAFPEIYGYDEEEWNGGRIHRIRHNIIHLTRGQVFTIENKTFFTFGGAYSTDRVGRIPHFSYWDEEIPSTKEMEEGAHNLKKHHSKVDYIITHTLPESTARLLGYDIDLDQQYSAFMKFLDEEVRIPVNYRKWFVGHYHKDCFANYSDNIRLVYSHVICICEGTERFFL